MSRLGEIRARHQLRCHESGCECLDALEAEVERLTEAYQWTDQVLTAVTAERDALAAQVARVEAHHRALTETHQRVAASRDSRRGASDHADLCTYATALERCRDDLRAALAGSEADTSEQEE